MVWWEGVKVPIRVASDKQAWEAGKAQLNCELSTVRNNLPKEFSIVGEQIDSA